MLRFSRTQLGNPVMRALEYHRHRKWEIDYQRVVMRTHRRFYNNIPWGLILFVSAATVLFGFDVGVGITKGASMGKDDMERGKKELEEKNRKAKEFTEKRALVIDNVQDHKEGRGPLAMRQGNGAI